jgi:undecaprenyl diphosphate synthase
LSAPVSGRERARESSQPDAELQAAVRAQPLPRHVAIIMDGNGRWAAARHLPRVAGHQQGVKAAREAVRAAAGLGIGYLTLYAFSSENWTRPAAEVEFLMRLLQSSVEAELPELCQNNVRLRVIGDSATLTPGVRQAIDRAIDATAGNTGLTLLIALNYGGRQELVRAVRAVAARIEQGKLRGAAIEEADIAAGLDTAGAPDPDLLIRTSGEFRLSNFLLWQVAYTELLVLPTLWPDFTARDLYLAVAEYQGRTRRFGGL